MIDTIKARILQPLSPSVRDRLGLVHSGFYSTGDARYAGHVSNLRVSTGGDGTNIEGSLARYLHSENLSPFDRGDVSRSVEKLADDLEISEPYLREARLSRLDHGPNLVVPEVPGAYLRALADPGSRNRRSYLMDTVYYGKAPFQVVLYDKLLQMEREHRREFRGRLREVYEGKQMLRVEVRHLGRLKEQFGHPVVLGHLDDAAFYGGLGPRVLSEVERFAGAPPVVTGAATNMKAMRRDHERAGIEVRGGGEAALARIAEQARSGTIDRSQASRMRRWVGETLAEPPSVDRRDLVAELISLVAQATAQTES